MNNDNDDDNIDITNILNCFNNNKIFYEHMFKQFKNGNDDIFFTICTNEKINKKKVNFFIDNIIKHALSQNYTLIIKHNDYIIHKNIVFIKKYKISQI